MMNYSSGARKVHANNVRNPVKASQSGASEDDDAFSFDIRNLSKVGREALRVGEAVQVFEGGEPIAFMPKALFLAVSSKPELVNSGNEIHVVAGTGRNPILHIVKYFNDVTQTLGIFSMREEETAFRTLAICRAARLLGVDRYTGHLHGGIWNQLHRDPADVELIYAILALENTMADPYFSGLAARLAYVKRQGRLDDDERLVKILAENDHLAKAVEGVNEKYEHRERLKREREERQRRVEEARALDEAWKAQRAEKYKANVAKNKAYWEEKKSKDKELEKSVQEKLRTGNRHLFTKEEARHFARSRG
ncbi:hypothetical protein BDV95DRAFT_654376 [Massariosphaeria phaeospora]|uniref:Uncharacterized protein n=1 Tax=Massariosphaeria phaeospora TaxID=100035 RepID=A0A7C8IE13_9PLEO|nr:hypothetical protein BDV95DRAFT_654376 [Massariosphaeria phaeospora]